ncbi:isopentenyl phosphate kinase [Methanobacterium alcaliphilum]|uniref:isopentenyl phosphate kinase n=1 Tax=Methanobacterium alcaliphilum TaxID=392018 RepID=UPI00200AECFC|nr:isopentenyl phosphate kinase [Methanobacterium alcaliphilum]MCK9151355.1 isopentenyl phosphate kinase [Methanobacterium alcaliphilum]
MIILKLGGSIITVKGAESPTIDKDNLNRISREIKNGIKKDLIIVHGAGSFGHPFARGYEIGNPITSEEEFERKRIGFSLTQSWVKKLNTLVCDAFREQGIPAVSIQPSSFIITHGKRIEIANLDLIIEYLNQGFVPVIYGDVVLDTDENIKMAVLSGDQIINHLAINLTPTRVILGTDVDGVFNKNPKKDSGAELIEKFTSLNDLDSLDTTTNIDVTGGMVGKLKELLHLAEAGIESEIINAGKEGLIEKALNGEEVFGTTIKSTGNRIN